MDAITIIQKLGGPSAAARLFECRPAAISQWKRQNLIPKARLLHLMAARPELFGEDIEPAEIDRREIERRESERRALDVPLAGFEPCEKAA